MIKAIYPGTFDPITNGHLDIITRSAKLFPHLVVAVAKNPSKNSLISFETRLNLTATALAHLTNVEVIGFEGLLVDLVKAQQISVIVRGVRNSTDFAYECQLAQVNEKLGQVESIFLPPSSEYGYLSSTVVREVYLHHGNIENMVPEVVSAHFEQVKAENR